MAIAFDQGSLNGNGSSGTNPTISNVNVTGSDRVLLVGLNTENGSVTVSTLNLDDGSGGSAQSFTQLGSYETGDARISLWYLIAPSTSSNRRIIATLSSGSNWMIVAASYTGVAQTSTFTTATQSHTATSPVSDTDTSDTNGSWQVGYAQNNNQLVLASGGSKRSQAPTPGVVETNIIADSNADVNSGNTNTLSWTMGAGTMEYISAMMRPVAAAGPANLKTYNTNVKSNIKTMNTNPIANVKTFDTNA